MLLKQLMLIVVISFTFINGCSNKPDYKKIKSEILSLHQQQIDAHRNKEIDFFTKDIDADGKYFSVGNGQINYPTSEEIKANFTSYLNSTEFSKYDNIEEPIIGCSDDGTMAWSIVRVNVAGKRNLDDGSSYEFDNIWAWITLFRRDGDKWIRMGEVYNAMEN